MYAQLQKRRSILTVKQLPNYNALSADTGAALPQYPLAVTPQDDLTTESSAVEVQHDILPELTPSTEAGHISSTLPAVSPVLAYAAMQHPGVATSQADVAAI